MAGRQMQTSDQVRIASFELCTCETFDFGIQPHLSVFSWYTSITDAEAVAISYTWGDFEREEFCVGHRSDDTEKLVFLTLGAEWNRPSFLRCLVDLTREHVGCWFDQICASQNPDDAGETLIAIPMIYRTLPVVIVLPGPVCNCIRDGYEAWDWLAAQCGYGDESQIPVPEESRTQELANGAQPRDLTEQKWSDLSRNMTKLMKNLIGHSEQRCLSSTGFCAWTDRVWTFQELRYAQKASLRYADRSIAKCVSESDPTPDLTKLAGYGLCYYRTLQAEGLDAEEIMGKIVEKASDFQRGLYLYASIGSFSYAMMLNQDFENFDWQDVQRPNPESKFTEFPLAIAMAELFMGRWANLDIAKELESPRSHFLQTLDLLGDRNLTATQPKDYVLSVFVDSPFYDIPAEFRTEVSSFALFKDAYDQLCRKMVCYIPTFWPAGLFGGRHGTAMWDSRLYLPDSQPTGSTSMYGPFQWLSCTALDPVAMSASIVPIKIYCRNRKKRIVTFAEGINIVGYHRWSQMIQAMLGHIISGPTSALDRPVIASVDRTDFEKELFSKVCTILHLDPQICSERGLKVGFTMHALARGIYETLGSQTFRSYELPEEIKEIGDPKNMLFIGLFNKDGFEQVTQPGAQSLTITLPHGKTTNGQVITGLDTDNPFYEAVEVVEGVPEYAVIGVWLPFGFNVASLYLEARICSEGGNAWLV